METRNMGAGEIVTIHINRLFYKRTGLLFRLLEAVGIKRWSIYWKRITVADESFRQARGDVTEVKYCRYGVELIYNRCGSSVVARPISKNGELPAPAPVALSLEIVSTRVREGLD